MSPMCQSFLKPFGKALALLFLPYLSAFLLQSNYLLRTYIAVLVAPTPNPPVPAQTTDGVAPTTSRRKWRIISAILVLSILSVVQFRSVLKDLTAQAIAEACNNVNKYILYASLYFIVTSVTLQIVYPGKDVVHRTPLGKYVTVKQAGIGLAARQHPFLALLLALCVAFFAIFIVGGLSDKNNLSITVVTMTYVASLMMAGKAPLRTLIKAYNFLVVTSVLVIFALIKYSGNGTKKLEEDEVWSTNLFKNMRDITFLPAALGTAFSGPVIATMLRFDFHRFCIAEPHAKLSYETVPHPTDPKMGKGIVVPRSMPVKFSKPYYTLSLFTWSMIRITTLALSLATGLPFKSPYDACSFGLLLELPIMSIIMLLFATMRGEAGALWRYRQVLVSLFAEAWVKKPLTVKKAQPVVKESEPNVKEGELIVVKEDEVVTEKEDESAVKEGELLLLSEDKVVPANEDLMV